MYRFDFETRALRMHGIHAVHSSDIPYLFGNFSPALVRPIFLYDRDKGTIRTVAQELQEDVVQFMRTGSLSWPQCTFEVPMCKCYTDPPWYEPAIPDQLLSVYERTRYRRQSFTGIPI